MCGTITLDEELIDVIISSLKESKVSYAIGNEEYRTKITKALLKMQGVKLALIAQKEMS